MLYEEFLSKVLEALKEMLPENTICRIEKISRNNDSDLDALIIREEGGVITPTIYMAYYFDLYKQCNDIEAVARRIFDCYENNKITDNFDMSFFFDFDKVKNDIVYKLVNREKNRKLLEDVPYIEYLDLAIVFCYYMDDISGKGSGSILIHNTHARLWEVEAEELLEYAKKNTKRLLGEQFYEFPPLRILSNETNFSGAAAILYDGTLKTVSDSLGGDLVIVPCSIHEVIIFKADEFDNHEGLNEIIRDVNARVVSDDEILSDHGYYYSREKDEVSMF